MRAAILRGAVLAIGIGALPASVRGADFPTRPNPQQIGMLRWYEANVHGASYAVGAGPSALAFDGAHVWVANELAGTVSKLRAADGASVGSWAVRGPHALAIDGSHVWVASSELDVEYILKLRLGDGALVASNAFPWRVRNIVYDGANVWVAFDRSHLFKLSGGNGGVLGMFVTPSPVTGLAFDGQSVWASCGDADALLRMKPGGGNAAETFSLRSPQGLAFDGDSMWVAHADGVSRLKAGGASGLETFPVGGSSRLLFDGAHIWIAGAGAGGVAPLTKLRAADGVAVATIPVPEPSAALAFDGINVWTANYHAGTVTKR